MRGLPSSIRGKLLAHNPTPTLSEMLSFVHRYRAIEDHDVPAHTSAATYKPTTDMDLLVCLMTELVIRQKALEDQVATSQQLYAAAIKQKERPRPKYTCFRCGTDKATLLESVAVQANAKTVPMCNATNVGGTDTSPANVETMRL